MAPHHALIVNADDLGWAPGRDRGILQTIDTGIVTSVSLLANGPHFTTAAEQVQKRQVGLGVHLNLSEGNALTGYIDGLTDSEGKFLGKCRARASFIHAAFDSAAALRELKAQVEKILAQGLTPDHVDYHQHMGIFPATLALIVEVCCTYEIRAARLSYPVEAQQHDPKGDLGAELHLYRRFGAAMRAELGRAGIFFPAGIWGMPLLNSLDSATLTSLLEQIPPGCWELMVHPGEQDAGIPFCGPERQHEQQALTCAAVREVIRARNIQLITFGDLHAYSHLLS